MSTSPPDGPPRRVEVLPEALSNQIAAGEVVERPASVIKELVENAIDAGASRILVDIEAAGKGLIRIVDDGCGMSAEDAATAVLRHATSKVKTASDLEAIGTLGFRGEALPSIASVSRFLLVTRRAETDVATTVSIEGGAPAKVGVGAGPVGTRIEVRDLFWNVPARLKFLKTDATEIQHVVELVKGFALGHPHIHFRLGTGGRASALDLPAVRRLHERVVQVLGKDAAAELHEVHLSGPPIRVTGFVSSPRAAKATPSGITCFVNGRRVRDRVLHHALVSAFGNDLGPGRFPQAVLWIHLDPTEVDVNVHPAKAEVRFRQPDVVHAAVGRAVQVMLRQRPWSAVAPLPLEKAAELPLVVADVATRPSRSDSHEEVKGRGTSPPARELSRGPFGESPVVHPAQIQSDEPDAAPGTGTVFAARDASRTRELLGETLETPRAPYEPAPTRESAPTQEPATSREPARTPQRPSETHVASPTRAYGTAAPEHASRLTFGARPTALFTASADTADGADTQAALHTPAPRPEPTRGIPRALPRGVTVIPARVDPPRAAARVLGEARSGLLVAEDDLGLLVIDRQATRELSTLQALGGNAPPQPLLIPARLDLAPHEAAALTARLGDLQALGVWIEPFGGPTFQLLGIPPAALGASPVRLLEAVASLCGARGEHDAEAVRRVIASVAATSRDGSAESRDQLVADALAVGGEARDHRGRRAFVRLTPTELTRRFET